MISGASRGDLNSFFWRQVVANSPDNGKAADAYEQGWTAINELIRADNTWSGWERNVFFANNGDGTFSEVSGVVGMDFLEDGRSFALADFDHDGRLEIALKNRSGPQLRIVKNIIDGLPPSISFRLRGTKSNRDAIGALITIHTDKGSQTRSVQAGSGFLSQHSKELLFGLGEAKGSVRARIRWPSGLLQELEDLPAGSRILVEEGSAQYKLEPFKKYFPPENPGVLGSQSAEQLPELFSTWLVEPVPAPQFSLPDLEEKLWAPAALHGKPALLTFWSMKSADCVAALKRLHRSPVGRTGPDSQLVSVNVDAAGLVADLRSFARDHDFHFPVLRASEDVVAVYNILYRYLFDRHRDLVLPTSFLLNDKGEIVKVYRGSADPADIAEDTRRIPTTRDERLARALPFPGARDNFDFGRNSLSFGSIFFQRGYLDQAESWFQRTADEDPTNAEAWYGLGSVDLSQGKNAQAREHFERAIKSTAGYPGTLPNAWNNLGLLATREGHTDEAIHNFQQALGLNPQHLIALENLGSAYRQQKRWDDARVAFEKALAIDPNDAESNYGLGMVFAQTDDADDAEHYWLRALKSRPGYPEALNNLGVLYLRTQRRDQAVQNFEECIRVAPAFDQSYLNLARVYAIEGKTEQARTTLVQLLRQHPDHALGKKMLEDLPR
jgi:tetratricopeptide (TPR) repeat protein/peroxiredoxin